MTDADVLANLREDLENLLDRFDVGWHAGIEIDARDLALLSELLALLEDLEKEVNK